MPAPLAKFAYAMPMVVHLADLDGLGHVNNARYLTYLETARNRWVFDLTGKSKLDHFDFILAHTSIDFRAAANLYDAIEVRLRPTRIGNSSWELEYQIRRDDGLLLIEARSVQVSYNYLAGRSMPVPQELRRHLETAMEVCREQ